MVAKGICFFLPATHNEIISLAKFPVYFYQHEFKLSHWQRDGI